MKNYAGEATCGALMAVSTAMQTNEWLQNIQIVICIIAGILGIILTRKELINEGIELGKQIKDIVTTVSEETKDKETK